MYFVLKVKQSLILISTSDFIERSDGSTSTYITHAHTLLRTFGSQNSHRLRGTVEHLEDKIQKGFNFQISITFIKWHIKVHD